MAMRQCGLSAVGWGGDGEGGMQCVRGHTLPFGGSSYSSPALIALNLILEIFHLLRCKIRMSSPLPFFTFVFLLLLFCVFTNRDSKTKCKMEKFRFAMDKLIGGDLLRTEMCLL